MDAIEAMKTRRSIKDYSGREVSRSDLEALLDAARYSPSGANKNPWRFVIVQDKRTLERLGETHPYCHWLAKASAAIAILADPASTRYWLEDCCLAAYSIWLAATAKGIGIAWSGLYQSDNAAESERRERFVRDALSIPDGLSVPIVLAVGYPSGPPAARKRPDLDEMVHWERYTEKPAP